MEPLLKHSLLQQFLLTMPQLPSTRHYPLKVRHNLNAVENLLHFVFFNAAVMYIVRILCVDNAVSGQYIEQY